MLNTTSYIFYSFRRCPYAMRARMALVLNQMSVEIREIILKHKPPSMLEFSPKGTVPVLIINNELVIDESREIMDYSISHSLCPVLTNPCQEQLALINTNDTTFKAHLDHYKYADRFLEFTQQEHRNKGEVFLHVLEHKLEEQPYLFGQNLSYADIAIFPFIRQFAHVDKTWFEQANYPNLQRWLTHFLTSAAFDTVMNKLPPWQESDNVVHFPPQDM